MGKKHSFFGNAIIFTFGTVLGLGAQFLLTSVVYGYLDAEFLGKVGIYYVWFSVFGAIVGLEAASSINNARIHYGPDKLPGYTSSMLGLGLVTLGIFAAVLAVLQGILVPAMGFPLPVLFSALLQGFFMFCTMLIAQKCRVLNKPVQFVVWTSLAQLLRLGLCLVFVSRLQENKYLGDVFGSLLSYGIVGVLAVVFLLKEGRAVGNRKYWKYALVITGPIVFHTLSTLVLGQADRLMLDKMLGVEEAGVYTYAYGIGSIANAIWLAFNNAWTVWYFDKAKEEKTTEIRDLYQKYTGFITLFTFAMILLGPDLVHLFAKDPVVAAGAGLTPVIMLGGFFMFLYTFPINYETYRAKTVFIAIGTVCAAAINIVLNLYFIPRWGALGAALTTLISYVVLFLFHYIIARFIVKGFHIKFTALLLPACITAGVALFAYLAIDMAALRWVVAAASLVASFFVFKKSRHIMM